MVAGFMPSVPRKHLTCAMFQLRPVPYSEDCAIEFGKLPLFEITQSTGNSLARGSYAFTNFRVGERVAQTSAVTRFFTSGFPLQEQSRELCLSSSYEADCSELVVGSPVL